MKRHYAERIKPFPIEESGKIFGENFSEQQRLNETSNNRFDFAQIIVECCCELNNTRDCDEHVFGQVSTLIGHYQLPIF